MIFKLRLGHWRFTITLYEVTDVIGVNSLLKDGNHIIMWDFDDVDKPLVEAALTITQKHYKLPNIYILETGKPDHYIAYCFARCAWRHTVEIVASTPFVCEDYFKWGVFRKRFTLRVTPKEGRKPKLVKILPSQVPESVNISELNSWVRGTKRAKSCLDFLSPGSSPDKSGSAHHIPWRLDVPAHNMRHSLTTHQ